MNQTKGLEKFLTYSIKTGLYLTLLMPLLVFRSVIFPFVFSKAIYFQALIEILTGLALIYFILTKKQEKRFSATPLFWALLVYVIVSLISALFGVDFQKSFWSDFERMDGLFFFIHLIIFFLLLRAFFNQKDWQRFFGGFLGISVLSGIISLSTPLAPGTRLSGVFGNPIYLAVFFLFSTFIGGYLLMKTRKVLYRSIIVSMILFFVVLMFFTASRGPIIGLFVGIIGGGVAFLFSRRVSRKIKIGVLAFSLILIILAVAGYGLRNSSFMKNKGMERIFLLKPIYGESRLLAWQISFKAWQDKFLFGWGRENYEVAFNKNLNPEILKQRGGTWFDKPHNKYLEIAINSGILGLLAYIAILGVLAFYLLKIYRKRQILVIFFASLIGAYLFQNFFAFDAPITYFCFFSTLAFLDFNYMSFIQKDALKDKRKTSREENVDLLPVKILALIIVFFLAFSFYSYNLLALRSNLLFKKAISVQENPRGTTKEIIELYKKSLRVFPQNRQQLSLIMGDKIVNQAVKGDKRFFCSEVLDFFKRETEKNIVLKPLNIKNYLVLIRIYDLLGISTSQKQYFIEAENTAFKALKIYPLRPEFYYEIAKIEKFLGNKEKANQYFKKAYPLKQS